MLLYCNALENFNYLNKASKSKFKVLIQKDDENSLKSQFVHVLISILPDMLAICKVRINRGIH